jgi:GT2 family glycosyltransferase
VRLSVVILNWNAAEDTAACVRSVRAWESLGGPNRPAIWVVDNGSDPPGIAPIRREFPEVYALESLVNRGFGGGCNIGIRAALDHGSEAVLLLNNDASVDASSVAALLATLESDPSIGVVGPTLWHRERCISAGGRNVALYANTHLRPRVPPVAPLNVDYVPGTVALIRREVFNRVGLLDEDFFFSGEMADLCQRARARGLRSVTEPRARARHNLDRSARVRQTLHIYYIVRNRFLFVRKHLPRRRAWLYARWVARAALTALVAVARGRPQRAGAVARGVLDGLRGRFGEQRVRAFCDRPGRGRS